MNPIKLIAKASRKMVAPIAKSMQKIKTNKPEVYIYTGIGMIILSFGLVAYESTKAPEEMGKSADKLEDLRKRKEELESGNAKVKIDGKDVEAKILSAEECVEELKQIKKDICKARLEGIWNVSKLYVPAVALLILGLGFDLRGVKILRKQNLALAATVSGLEKFINYYRSNVIKEQGEEADRRFASGISGSKDISEIVKNEDGTESIKKTKVPTVRNPDGNPWRFEYSPTYFRSATGDPDHDICHIKNVQEYFNHKYGGSKKYGRISYYEVLEYLDPIWEAIDADGSVEIFCREYGWGHSPKGDGFIDLGVYRGINEAAIKGVGDVVYIEANCDGRLSELKNAYKEKYLV